VITQSEEWVAVVDAEPTRGLSEGNRPFLVLFRCALDQSLTGGFLLPRAHRNRILMVAA